ncbi:MAG: hypothetical protein WC947_01475 [Elusimicrobiota bacterium]
MPEYFAGQIKRSLIFLGWDVFADVKFNLLEEAKDITADRIKVLGMNAKGTG